MANMTQPLASKGGGKAPKPGKASQKPDKSGFGSGLVSPKLVTPFTDAVFKK